MRSEQKQLQAALKAGLVSILGRATPRANRTHTAELVKNLQLVKSEAMQIASHAEELNRMIIARPSSRASSPKWADDVLRLLRLRFHPEVIDGALVHIASELDAHQMLREQLSALRRTAHAADREAAQLEQQWADLGPCIRRCKSS